MGTAISVVLPVYNAPESFLRASVGSVLDQTFEDFELIIVDDGSEEECRRVLRSFQDPRIRILYHEKNKKLPASLNDGLDASTGKYIVRMDSDDISLPERFFKQVRFMEENPDIMISGTLAQIIGSDKVIGRMGSYSKEENRIRLLFGNFGPVHPTVIMRRDFINENGLRYDPFMKDAEDYDFWVRAAKLGKIAVLDDILLRYRVSPGQISKKASDSMSLTERKISHNQLEEVLGRKMTEEESAAFYDFRCYHSDTDLKIMDKVIGECLKQNGIRKVFDQYYLKHYFAMIWLVSVKKKIQEGHLGNAIFNLRSLDAVLPWNLVFSLKRKNR